MPQKMAPHEGYGGKPVHADEDDVEGHIGGKVRSEGIGGKVRSEGIGGKVRSEGYGGKPVHADEDE